MKYTKGGTTPPHPHQFPEWSLFAVIGALFALIVIVVILYKKVFYSFYLYLIKIATQKLFEAVFKIVLAFPEAEICGFFMLHLA